MAHPSPQRQGGSPGAQTSPARGATATTYEINPLTDQRWQTFVARHPRSSVFHSVPWLSALARTYGYKPVAYTTSPPGKDLDNGIVFCSVESWITGRRLVSLPFSDHCAPLVEDTDQLKQLVTRVEEALENKLAYVEFRTGGSEVGQIASLPTATSSYCLHELDIGPDVDSLMNGLHMQIKRNIQRAQREGLTYKEGRTAELLDAFVRLNRLTRRRHQIPPQPPSWFANLAALLGDDLNFKVACFNRRPVAAIMTLRHRDTITYKYSCSDPEFNKLGGPSALIWDAIQQAKHEGLRKLDFGRSDYSNQGLLTFKDRWGSQRSNLTYWTISKEAGDAAGDQNQGWKTKAGKAILPHLPEPVFAMVGRLFYRHIG